MALLLFDRTGKRLKLTDAGELLKQKAELLLLQFDETIKEVKGTGGRGARSSVDRLRRLLYFTLATAYRTVFRERFPEVTFKISKGDHFYLGELLEKRTIDLVIARLPFEALTYPQQYSILPLPSDPFVAVIPSAWTDYSGDRTISMRGACTVSRSLP